MSDQRRARGLADCRGRAGCSWPGLIEAYRDRLPAAANWTAVTLLEATAPHTVRLFNCTRHLVPELQEGDASLSGG